MSELDRWVRELQEELGLDPDVVVDVNAILDLARVAAHEVDRPAAPLTTFVVGYAAGRASGAGVPTTIDQLTARAAAFAEGWSARLPSAAGEALDIEQDH
jgi:2-methylcitrate dehydratase PrpD